MTRPFTRKRPTGCGKFTYARLVDRPGFVSYRLCRRDDLGAHHYASHVFFIDEPRDYMAVVLNTARHQLRNTVDEIDLALMGVV